jgi:hypothetical protein
MVDMATRRTTVVLSDDEQQALRRASKAEGISQSQLIRKGIRAVTSAYRKRAKPLTGWLKLSRRQLQDIRDEKFGDYDR